MPSWVSTIYSLLPLNLTLILVPAMLSPWSCREQQSSSSLASSYSHSLCARQGRWKLNRDVKKCVLWLEYLDPTFMCSNSFVVGPEFRSCQGAFQRIYHERFSVSWGTLAWIALMDHGFSLIFCFRLPKKFAFMFWIVIMYDNLIVLYCFIFPSTSFIFFLYPRGHEPELDA